MARKRVLFYVQHLLGIGHLVRAGRIAEALGETFEVLMVVGGELPSGLLPAGVARFALPPVRAGAAGFSALVHPDGTPFGPDDKTARRDRLLGCFDAFAPDVLLIEAFPFGRRPMRFELIPLLERAAAAARPPLVACSVRDILQQSRKPGRDRETVELIRARFDAVLVHGDPAFCRLDESFPLAAELGDRIVHTGLVGPEEAAVPEGTEAFDVVVSVGGGAVGAELIATALAARPLSRLAQASWLVLTGPNGRPAEPAALAPGVTLRAFAPDLPARLRRAQLSISQAGYNTATDLMAAPACRAVLVPFAADGESEQAQRAAAMARQGWAVAVPADGLTPARLAAAIDRALALPPGRDRPPVDGAARAAAHLLGALDRRRAARH